MNLKNLSIVSAAVMVFGVFVAACSGGGGGSGNHTLSTGTYNWATNPAPTATPNTCFSAGDASTIVSVIAGSDFLVVSTSDTAFSIQPDPASLIGQFGIIPPIEGAKAGDVLSVPGATAGAVVLASNCTLAFSPSISGMMTANDEFDASLLVDVTASRTTAGNLAQSCAKFAGGAFPGSGGAIGFPILTNATNGSCNIGLQGHLGKTS